MSLLNGMAAVKEEIIKCMKCGNCQAACPIYKELRLEPAVARGKIHLAGMLAGGELKAAPALAERFALCLTCLACTAVCPSGVKVCDIILAARAALAAELGLPFAKRAAFAALTQPKLFRAGLKTFARLQGLAFRRLAPFKMKPRFPLGLEMRRVVPPLATASFLDRAKEKYPVEKPLARVALFAGCLNNYVYPRVGHAALHVLQANRVEVVIPREQHCCGAPSIYNGATGMAREMARSHVDIFGSLGVDAVITMCGTCGESFAHFYPRLLEDVPGYGKKARELARKTTDIARFLYRLPLDKGNLRSLDLSVTYHQPCHLGRGLGVVKEPVELLSGIPGTRYTPLKDPARCCGNAGSFSLSHYHLSYRILGHKLKDIAGTGAQVVATGCPACKMQLTDGLTQENMSQEAMHTVEILAHAYGFAL
ncbi:(Fe-S)-binding protein [Desulfovirgula thermocuniculi]|uniref:(Fe-S)-binding protein n=1 Tax=Desulfovirgula thermocuniculi TaxID=348842 RepID=UPI0003FAE801|nr:(Fe-S)-binding protein [Desulfovirgula thermocuniculi]